jgi:hypothetical protein
VLLVFHRNKSFRVWTLAVVVIAIALRAHAQSSQVSGQALDTSNASVAGAELTLTRLETGDVRKQTSNSEGYYAFPLLLPGHYALKIEREGYKTQEQKGIVVETGAVSIVNIRLAVGKVEQVVNVEASVPLLQSASAAVGQVVENKTINDMPLLDRRSLQLQRLNGFVVGNGTGSNATFAIAGGRGNNANYLIDGGSAQNLLLGVAILTFDPPIESVQEFNVAISNYAAELGRTGGAVIQMTTKSGTNHFHGSAYEYFLNDALQAIPYFSTQNPRLRYNLFGASMGGPVKKDRTQFFFNYEGRRTTQTTTKILNVPTQAEVTGDFSALSTPIIDPNTGKQAVYNGTLNVLPPGELDPVGVKMASFYPAPNIAGASPNNSNFRTNDPAVTVVDAYVARIDHVINDSNRIFGRLLAQTDHTTASVFPTPGTDNYATLVHDYFYNVSGTWYHNFSPTVMN